MPRYRVIETVVYHVVADDEDAACDVIVQSDDPDAYFAAVTEREAELIDDGSD